MRGAWAQGTRPRDLGGGRSAGRAAWALGAGAGGLQQQAGLARGVGRGVSVPTNCLNSPSQKQAPTNLIKNKQRLETPSLA